MTINEAQNLLNNSGIPFFKTHYTDEADFYHHALMFPYTKTCKKEEIIALVVLKTAKRILNYSLITRQMGILMDKSVLCR